MQEALEGGLFEPEKTPAQKAALERLETTLALVEGWVDEVVGQATEARMPAAAKLQEAVRRRRAAGGPAEQTFAALVGLELRPRRLRDASTLWGSLRSRQGAEARDAVWAHPDLLPTAADLDDPLGFREHVEEPQALTDAEFDAALAELLDDEYGKAAATATPPRGVSRAASSLHADALRLLAAGPRRTPGRSSCGCATSTTSRSTPTGCSVAASPTTSPRAPGAVRRPRPQVLLTLHAQGRRLVPARRALRGRRTPRWPAPRCARRSRSPGSTGWSLDPGPRAPRRARGGVLRPARAGAPPRRAVPRAGRPRTPCRRSARSRSTCAGGRSDGLPTDEPSLRDAGRGWPAPG